MADEKSTKVAVPPIDRIKIQLHGAKDRFARALTKKGVDADEFIIGMMAQINANDRLLDVVVQAPETILLCGFRAALLGFRMDGISGESFMVPRRRKLRDGSQRWEANFQIGYQGVLKSLYRSKEIKSIFPMVVRQADEWMPPRFTERGVEFLHAPNYDAAKEDGRGEIIAAYTRVRLTRDDEPLVFSLPIEQIYRDHRDVSQAYDADNPKCPWIRYEEQMVLKTMIHVAGKYCPKSSQVETILQIAERADKGFDYTIPGEEELRDPKSITLTPESIIAAPRTVEDDAHPDQPKQKIEAKPETKTETKAVVPREPGDDDEEETAPEDKEMADLFE